MSSKNSRGGWSASSCSKLADPASWLGADLETLRPLLVQADTLTLWKSGAEVYSLLLRPLLPEEIE
ncbi:MAG: hypothetical protein KKA32_12030 [Actinobacteria bacterium]|nr:hypothetical protein [Actinomycetota bacterium]